MAADRRRRVQLPLVICAILFLTPLLQLLPLPFEFWAKLPGRETPAEALRLAGADAWLTYGLDPAGVKRALFYLVPVIGVFLGVCDMTAQERRWLLLVTPLAAMFSLGIGAMQIAQGEGSRFYFYDGTNIDSAVGLFANRNHQATLFVTAMPLIAGWMASRRGEPGSRILTGVIAVSVLILMILGLMVVKSRAGILLGAPAVLGSLFLLWVGERSEERRTAILGVGIAALAAMVVLGLFAARPVLERFLSDDVDGRIFVTPATFQAALTHLPFGSGLGSFPSIYAGVESVDRMGPAFWNHAHNDYAELLLEAGVLAISGLALFLFWWVKTIFKTRKTQPDNTMQIWGGALAVLLVMAHSAVDYPLRTLAIACLFAFACGLMTEPLQGETRFPRLGDIRLPQRQPKSHRRRRSHRA